VGLIDVTVTGNKAILDHLAALDTHLQGMVQSRLEQAGQMALEKANELVPVRTGYLQSRNMLDVQPGVVTVSNDASYAVYVELGHRTRSGSTVPPQPFLVPAWMDAGQWLKENLTGLLG
jgi:hypothetical protein